MRRRGPGTAGIPWAAATLLSRAVVLAAPTPAPTLATCSDTSGDATGNHGSTCDSWTFNPSSCLYAVDYKYYDDSDFSVEDMCCACGGGAESTAITPTTTTTISRTTQEDTTCIEYQTQLTDPIMQSFCGHQSYYQDRSPTASGCDAEYSADVRLALANGMFGGADGTNRDCGSGCLYDVDAFGAIYYRWQPTDNCWLRNDPLVDCLGFLEQVYATDRAASLCQFPHQRRRPGRGGRSLEGCDEEQRRRRSPGCSDTSGDAVGRVGYTCDQYNSYPNWCSFGYYDDDDFTVMDMCCACGGGKLCVWNATSFGAADCDAAWTMSHINCQSLEDNYGLNCTGCACPGDTPAAVYTTASDVGTIGACSLEGLLDVTTECGCEEACAAMDRWFTAGFWSHSPGCFAVVSGPYNGNCHWNTNTNPYIANDANNRAVCVWPQELCADSPNGWTSSTGLTCQEYANKKLCTQSGGHGSWWNFDWGTIADKAVNGIDALQACCLCGGGTTATPSSTRQFEVFDNWRKGHLGSHVELPVSDSLSYGSVVANWRACLSAGMENPEVKQVVYKKSARQCYPMSEASPYDSDGQGGSNADWRSAQFDGVITASPTLSPTPSPTEAPTAAVEIVAEYAANETLPVDVTASDLAASIVYAAAKQTGLAAALSVPTSDITITGFTLGARRLEPAVRQLTGTVSVTTSFKVVVADISAGTALSTTIAGASAAIKAETDSAMAAADWSDESVITAAPTMTVPVVATPIVNAVPPASVTTSTATTVLVSPVQAGAQELVVESEEGFSVGDTAVITGGGNSETRDIASFGSIVLDAPLEYGYPAGSSFTKAGDSTSSNAQSAEEQHNSEVTIGVIAGVVVLLLTCVALGCLMCRPHPAPRPPPPPPPSLPPVSSFFGDSC